jgi:electron transfer flavoprotein beta subunit
MQIYVCVKHVPDSAAHIHIVDRKAIDENVAFLLNPFDEHALTEAVRIRQSLPGSGIVAVCLGREDAEKTLRSALAMGADRGLLIASDQGHDAIETARALKSAIEQDGTPDLIFTGKESIDAEGMQTMFRVGALFDFPVVNNVVKLDIVEGKAVADTDLSSGIVDTYELTLPCVIGAGKGLNTPRYPTFPDVVKSKKKPIKTIRLNELKPDATPAESGMTVVELAPLKQKREPKQITGDPGAVAQKIVSILKQEAKVI